MKDDAPDELDIKMPHAQIPYTGLPHRRKGFRKKVVQGFSLGEPLLEFVGLCQKFGVGQLLKLGFPPVDGLHQRCHPLEFPLILAAKESFYKLSYHMPSPTPKMPPLPKGTFCSLCFFSQLKSLAP